MKGVVLCALSIMIGMGVATGFSSNSQTPNTLQALKSLQTGVGLDQTSKASRPDTNILLDNLKRINLNSPSKAFVDDSDDTTNDMSSEKLEKATHEDSEDDSSVSDTAPLVTDESLLESFAKAGRPPLPKSDSNQLGEGLSDAGHGVQLLALQPLESEIAVTPDMLLKQADILLQSRRFKEAAEIYGTIQGISDKHNIEHRLIYSQLGTAFHELNNNPSDSDEYARAQDKVKALLTKAPRTSYTDSLMASLTPRPLRLPGPAKELHIVGNGDSESKSTGILGGMARRIREGVKSMRILRRFRTGQWDVLETTNFRVHHNDEQLAGRIADVAERARIELIQTWFSDDTAKDWNPKCDIFLYESNRAYARATGQSAASPGHSTTKLQAGRIVSRKIELRQDGPDVVHAILPHEITHVVMADYFPEQSVPRWADEGMAVLSEPTNKKYAHWQNLERFVENGQRYTAQQLMTMRDYPEGKLWPLFYSQSVSLVEYLVERGGTSRFLVFLKRSQRNGFDRELASAYGFRSYGELDAAWREAQVEQFAEAHSRKNQQLGLAN